MDGDSPSVGFQFVDPNDSAQKCRVQWTVGLEVGRHVDAHPQLVMTCLGGKIQTVL